MVESPLVAYRDCEFCQRYLHNEATGEVYELAPGKPMERNGPPPCRTSFGCKKGTPEDSKALTPRNHLAFRFHRRCKAIGRFPDDWLVAHHAIIIEDAIANANDALKEKAADDLERARRENRRTA